MMIFETFDRASVFHGHKCPGLAIGVRAAVEARRLLEIEAARGRGLYCIAESSACYLDGIQFVFGTTVGGGDLEIRRRGKAAFNFYDRNSGRSLRLAAIDTPEGLSREACIEFILTAPLARVFHVTECRFQAPPNLHARRRRALCARCGESCDEPFLRIRDGEILCLDCAESGEDCDAVRANG